MSIRDWSGQQVLILGAARQGLALAEYLARHGASVLINDRRAASDMAAAQADLATKLDEKIGQVSWVLGGHPLSVLNGIDLVCVSGGVPLELPLIQEALRRSIRLSNDSQIFLEAAPCKVIGITGSAGKTTTTTLVGRIASADGRWRKVWVGGNIGFPLILGLDEMTAEDLAVMELSSFQLELMDRSPDVAAILNITPNHLDRHGTMAAYTAAKARILDFQTPQDLAVLGREDPVTWSLANRVKGELYSFGIGDLIDGLFGTFVHDNKVYLRSDKPVEVMSVDEIELRGEHNLLNVLAACAITAAAGVNASSMAFGVQGFRGVSHRLEYVRTWGGADWYNDSIATAPERSMAAIRSFSEPIVLLAGGRDKNLPWSEFARLVNQRVDHVILFGEAAEKILTALQRQAGAGQLRSVPITIQSCTNLPEAVALAAQVVQSGDVVLLSPGGTSFDEFRDFEERGECFEKLVKQLP